MHFRCVCFVYTAYTESPLAIVRYMVRVCVDLIESVTRRFIFYVHESPLYHTTSHHIITSPRLIMYTFNHPPPTAILKAIYQFVCLSVCLNRSLYMIYIRSNQLTIASPLCQFRFAFDERQSPFILSSRDLSLPDMHFVLLL